MILDIQTRLPPPSLSARNRLEFYMCKKKKGERKREKDPVQKEMFHLDGPGYRV